MPQLPRPCQRFSNGFEPIHLIKSEQLPALGVLDLQKLDLKNKGGASLN
jgi:hypothetical protein